MKFKIVLISTLLLLCSIAYGQDFYLDSSVQTSGDGSMASPWKNTIDISWSSYGAGDTLYVSGGPTNSSQSYMMDAPLNFVSAGPPDMMYVKVWPDPNHNGVVIFDGGEDGLPDVDNGGRSSGGIFEIRDADYLTIDGEVNGERHIKIRRWGKNRIGTYYGISGSGASTRLEHVIIRYVEIENDLLTCPEPTGVPGTPEYDLFDGCMYDSGKTHPEWNNQKWNFQINGCSYTGKLGAGSVFEYNYLHGCVFESILAGSGEDATGYDQGAVVRYNRLRSYRNERGRGGPDGIKTGSGTTIYGNLLSHEPLENAIYNPNHVAEDGIQINVGAKWVKVYNNTVYGYSQGPIRLDPSTTVGSEVYHVQIYNNLLVSTHVADGFTQRGIELDGQTETGFEDIKIFNNTIVGFPVRGIHLSLKASTHNDIEIKNNILVDSNLAVSTETGVDMSLVDIDYNLSVRYDTGDRNSTWPVQGHEPYVPAGGFSFVNYTKPALGSPDTTFDLHIVGSDNMAKGAGVDLSSYFTTDHDGDAFTIPYDLGALVFDPDSIPEPPTPDPGVRYTLGSGWNFKGGHAR